jgi:6-phosphogluconolactonase (cycloisomerase 2 family)
VQKVVFQFTIDQKFGGLTANGDVATKDFPFGLAADPGSKFLYVALSSVINVYKILANGELSLLESISAGTPSETDLVAVHPSGHFVYVTDSRNAVIHQFKIQADGRLASIGVVDAPGAFGIAIHPSGKFVFTANLFFNSASSFKVNTLTGQLTPVATTGGLNMPNDIAVEPKGAFAYIPDLDDGTVAQFKINPVTGALSALGLVNTESPPNPKAGPFSLAITH